MYDKPLGALGLITGPMFAGKTSLLIETAAGYTEANDNPPRIFKHALDTRGKNTRKLTTHEHKSLSCIPVTSSAALCAKVRPTDTTIIIDEVQFFDDLLVPVVLNLLKESVDVLASGLYEDYRGKPYRVVEQLSKYAFYHNSLRAKCVKCGLPATKTQRLVDEESRTLIGGSELYEPRCDMCHTVNTKTKPLMLARILRRMK